MKNNQNKVMTTIACLVLVAAFIAAAVILVTRPADNGEPVTIPAETETVTEEAAEADETAEAEAVPAEEETLTALEKIRKEGKLVIAMEGAWQPWTYHDESGALTGFDVEVGALIAEGLGVTPEYKETAWDGILAGVDSGRFDIACNGVGYTEKRAESYNFSTPYVYTEMVLVVRADNEEIKTLDDLKGKKTANSPNSTYAMRSEAAGAEVVYVDTLGETMELLQQGRVEATLNAKDSVDAYLAEHPEAQIKVVLSVAGEPVAIPMQKGERTETLVAEINRILEEARQNGKLAELSNKYFGRDLTKEE